MKSALKSCRLGLSMAIPVLLMALLLALLLNATVAQAAAPLLDENFSYGGTAGNLTAVSGGNWTAHSSAGILPVGYVTTTLSMPDYASSGIGGSATFRAGSAEDVNRTFTAQSSGTVYYAALVKLSSASTTGDYFLHLKDAGTMNFRGKLWAQDLTGNLRFGVSSSASTGITYGATNFSYNTTYLVVVKYNITTGASALYISDTCMEIEPEIPLVTSTGTATPMSAMAIRQGTYGPVGTVDGIRVATNWADAANCGPVLTFAKSATPATDVDLHGPVTYTLLLKNVGGTDDTNVLVTDTLPAKVDFARWVAGGQPTGAAVAADEITWSGTVTAHTTITFAFVVAHNGDYGDVVTNTAQFSGTKQAGIAKATFTVEPLTGDVTFVYHDLEDVVRSGDQVYLAGDFNGPITTTLSMTHDVGYQVFTATVPNLVVGNTYKYKYGVAPASARLEQPQVVTQWNWLQKPGDAGNRSVSVTGDKTVHDYRNVAVDWASLDRPPTLQTNAGEATEPAYGRVYIQDVTDLAGEGRGIRAEVGYGDVVTPANWTWFPMTFNVDDPPSNDEFMGVITPTAGGVYSYAVRFTGNWGTDGTDNPNLAWVYGDLDGAPPFSLDQTGVLTSAIYDIEVVKTAAPAQVFVANGAGSLVTYTIAVNNLSTVTDTARVTVTDLLPDGFVYVRDTSLVPPASTDPLVWVLTDPITHGEGLTFKVVVSATDAITRSGLYTNEVTVTAAPPDWVAGNNADSADVMVYRILPIGEARLRPLNELVVVEGTVTVEPGVFTYSGQPRYMYIQDDTGGVLIYRGGGLSAVARHHRVRVIGARSEYRAETEFIPVNTTDVTDLGLSTPISPAPTATGAVNEDVEGQLLQVEGCIVGKPAAYRLQVDDGSGMVEVYRYYNLGQTGDPNYIDFGPFVVGSYLWAVGVSRGYQETYGLTREVVPRGPADITKLDPTLAVAKEVAPAGSVKPGSVVTYTLILSNQGEGRVLGAVMTDVLPLAIDFGGWVEQPTGAIQAGGTITWTGDIGAEPVRIVFTATVGADLGLYGQTITNTAVFRSTCAGSGSVDTAFTTTPLYHIYLPIVARRY